MASNRVSVEGRGTVGSPSIGTGSPRLPARLRRHLSGQPGLVPRGSRVIVALSGGADSTALLHLLSALRSDLDLRLEAAHFDHGVREGSAADARHARALSEALGVPCHVGSPDMPPAARQSTLRAVRYQWLDAVVRERSADRLAVAHHADDQAETVLFRLMRGTDLRGLSGIPARRGTIVRPLLPFRRAEIGAYLSEIGASWIDDPSNEDRRWTRARLRAEVIPALQRAAPGTVARLVALGEAAAMAYETAERAAAVLLKEAEVDPTRGDRLALSRSHLLRGGPELLAIALRGVARAGGVDLTAGGTRAGVEFISGGPSGGRVMVGGGLEISREFDHVLIGREAGGIGDEALLVHARAGEGRLRIGERAVRLRWRPVSDGAQRPERIAVTVPPEHYPLTFRGWRHGDRIRLPGGTRKLKKLFGDRRVPRSERARIPVLADRTGKVLWIEGLATAQAGHPGEGEPSLLEFELRDE